MNVIYDDNYEGELVTGLWNFWAGRGASLEIKIVSIFRQNFQGLEMLSK
jgi:hypothetical protein